MEKRIFVDIMEGKDEKKRTVLREEFFVLYVTRRINLCIQEMRITILATSHLVVRIRRTLNVIKFRFTVTLNSMCNQTVLET